MIVSPPTMGNSDSSQTKVEQRYQNVTIKRPMPESTELERRFTKVLASMDLPPDKAKVLKQYDDEKKWDLICDQERVHAKESPGFYLQKLKTYLDPKASRSSRKRKMLGDSTSTQVLRDLEISLRTNHIEWVRDFLNEENRGLDTLIDYLSFRQVYLRHEQIISKTLQNSLEQIIVNGHGTVRKSVSELDTPKMKRATRHIQKLNMGEAKDDIHVCIMCLRAIMNNKYGFNMIIEHTEAINCIALSLNHKSLRTKALVLELLAAICLVKGGHQIILNAFDNFKEVCSEKRRFETLMDYFMNYEMFQFEFMVACMQFINIIVHSVEDMNFRIHLQYEFTQLGLDDYLEKIKHTESEELQVQISAYLDNVFDVSALMEDSETKSAALERVAELEEQLSNANDQLQEMENEHLAKMVELETLLQDITAERDELKELHSHINEEVQLLKLAVSEKEEESRHRQSLLENKIIELENLQSTLPKSTVDGRISGSSLPPPMPPPLPSEVPQPPKAPPAPPAPPPPPGLRAPSMPPPPPGMMMAPGDAMTIKRRVQTKYKLPTLNWIALKPNQVKGTVFNELDDDKLYSIIDFNQFEEDFKIGSHGPSSNIDNTDSLQTFGSKRFKRPEMVSLLEHNRLRNIAISRRKLEMSLDVILRGIHTFDLKTLQLDYVEVLLRMVPSETETKAYKEYEREKKPINVLTDEDKFLLQLCKVERLSQKLNIMSYMGNFNENIQLITPQIHAVITAARSIRNSKKIRKILEVILAFGNYLNSSKRGPAYGFKLQSLDVLLDTKSADKKVSLMHYIVDTIKKQFPDVMNFDSELRFVEKASTVSLENVLTDVHELEKGMDLIKKECDLRKDYKDNSVLKEFRANNEDKLRKLLNDAKTAQDAFSDVVEYFGESSRTLAANTFFSLFFRFTRAFKQAEIDNETRRKMEAAAKEALKNPVDHVNQKNKINKKSQQDAVINELKSKTQLVKEKKLLKQDEVYNGALEDILMGLKNEPYRRADAVRRSQRRRQENVRLSRTMDELNV